VEDQERDVQEAIHQWGIAGKVRVPNSSAAAGLESEGQPILVVDSLAVPSGKIPLLP